MLTPTHALAGPSPCVGPYLFSTLISDHAGHVGFLQAQWWFCLEVVL